MRNPTCLSHITLTPDMKLPIKAVITTRPPTMKVV